MIATQCGFKNYVIYIMILLLKVCEVNYFMLFSDILSANPDVFVGDMLFFEDFRCKMIPRQRNMVK